MTAARISPQSLRTDRNVYVCVSTGTAESHQPRVDAVLLGLIRPGDRLLSAGLVSPGEVDPVRDYANRHGLVVAEIDEEPAAPDLIVIIIDPSADNTATLRARQLAASGPTDLFITELPEQTV